MIEKVKTPLTDRELWACALEVEKARGDQAPRWIAERIGALALSGGAAGVATWRAIAGRLDHVRRRDAPCRQ